MTALAVAIVLVIPVAVLIGLLQVATVLERRRGEVVARQIALSDAIHAELGPLVAPRVRRGRGGRWIAVLPVPPGQPQLELMIEIAQEMLGPAAEVVLVTQEPALERPHRRAAAPALALSGARVTR
jgi:hypothetical protein